MSKFNEFIKAIKREDFEEVKKLFNKGFIKAKDSEGLTALHWASYYNKEGDTAEYLIKEGCDFEAEDDSGWRSIHFAAAYGRVAVLRVLTERGCTLGALTKRGRSASDLALKYGQNPSLKKATKEIIESASGLDFEWGDNEECREIIKRAETAAAERLKEDLNLINNNSLSKIMNVENGNTLLDKVLSNKDPRILEAIKSKPVNVKEINEWRDLKLRRVDPESYQLLHECLFTRCLYQRYDNGFNELCCAEIVNKNSLFMGPPALETAVECGASIIYVEKILHKLVTVNESWEIAEDLARKKNTQTIISAISRRRTYLKKKEKNGFNILHIAVLKEDPDLAEYIVKNNIVNIDEDHKKKGTALSLSYFVGDDECIECLQHHKANVNTLDKFKQTPLHEAIYSRIEEHSEYLVKNMLNIEAEDFMNFTVLERSIMNDCERICEGLVNRGARCDKYVKIERELLKKEEDLSLILYIAPNLILSNKETIYTLCLKINKTIYPRLFDVIDQTTVNVTDGFGNTLLHLSAVMLMPNICLALIQKSANVDQKNKNKNTPLLELLKRNYDHDDKVVNEDMIETVNVLIEGGASLDESDDDERSALQNAMNYHNENLLLALIHKRKSLVEVNKTQWSEWLNKKYYFFMKEMMPLIHKTSLAIWITADLIKTILKNQDMILAKIMYYKACCDVQIEVVETMLQNAALCENKPLFEEMLKHEIPFNNTLNKGETVMTWLIKERKIDFINLALSSRNVLVLLEKESINKKLPLHVCIECEYWNVFDQLLFDTISVNKEDEDGNTPLSLLLTKMSETTEEVTIEDLKTRVRHLITKSGDIYKENKLHRAAISYCTKPQLKVEVELYFRKHQRQQQAPSPGQTNQVQQGGAEAIPICEICEDEPKDCVLNCGHIFGRNCAEKVYECFKCRRQITKRRKVYL